MTNAEIDALEKRLSGPIKSPWRKEMYYEAVILELIAELRQARAERDWMVQSFHMIDCPPHAKDVELCNAQNKCPVCWRLAAKEATCQK